MIILERNKIFYGDEIVNEKQIKCNNTDRNIPNMFNKNQGNIVFGCNAIKIDNEKPKSQIMKLHLIFFLFC